MTDGMADFIGPMDILMDDTRITLNLSGKAYSVRKLTMGDMSALQAKLKKEFKKPIHPQDIALELATPQGMTFLLWRRLQESDPTLTLEKVSDMVPASADALQKMLVLLGLELRGDDAANPLAGPSPASP